METNQSKKVQVCKGPRCTGRGSDKVYRAVQGSYERAERCECLAQCKQGPNVSVNGEIMNFCNDRNVVGKIKRELRKASPPKEEQKDISNTSIDSALDELF